MMSLIPSLLLLVILKDCSGQIIEGCGPDNPMDVDVSRNIFKCQNQIPNRCMGWRFEKILSRQVIAVACLPNLDQFTTSLSNVVARRYNVTSGVLEISSTDMSHFLGISCTVYDDTGTKTSTYTCNLINRALPTMSCGLQGQADNSLSVVCSVSNIYIHTRSYSCEFTVTFQDDTTVVVRSSAFISTVQSRGPGMGSCFAHQLPNRANIRNVEATLLPDNVRAIATFG